MLERAIGVAAICMRRLIECRLVTDRFRDSKLAVHEIHRNPGTEWREPLVSRTVSEIFNNYDTKARYLEQHAPKMVADKILHSRVIGMLCRSAYLPDGLLLASDTQRKTRLFHFTEHLQATATAHGNVQDHHVPLFLPDAVNRFLGITVEP